MLYIQDNILLLISLLAGNIYVFISLKTETIGHSTRIPLFVVFSAVSAVGLVLFLLITWRSYIEINRDVLNRNHEEKKGTLADVCHTLKIAMKLLSTRNMLLLLIPFAYSGNN